MDVHAPHEPVHTWKDFFIHLAIITIGLFIALMLESFVEYIHHRHIVREARENIREEIERNHTKLQKDLGYLDDDTAHIKTNIATLHRLRADPKDFKGDLTYTIRFNGMENSAWTSARDMGALIYMPLKEVQNTSDIYDTQTMVTQRVDDLIQRETHIEAPILAVEKSDDLTPAQIDDMLHQSAICLVDITVLKQILQQLDTQYVDALKS